MRRNPVLALVAVFGVGVISGAFAADRRGTTLEASVPCGRGVIIGEAATDALPYWTSYRFVIHPSAWGGPGSEPQAWAGPAIAVVADEAGVVAGDRVSVAGTIRAEPQLIRGAPVAGRVYARSVVVIAGPSSPVMAAGNSVRRRVQAEVGTLGNTAEAALLRGFLIGDIADLPRADTESLRRAGLTHYVAVSGSTVALVLGAWWLVLGPTGAGNRIRAATGLVLLVVFVVATRWEPSVIRAATMAALVLGGRVVGVVTDAWAALGGAAVLLLAISGDLAYDAGFQLSVAATAGVLLGARLWSDQRPRMVWTLLAATVSAQVAVAPIVLLHFGSVPLLAPVANLIAAPLVTVATALAGGGVILGWEPLLAVAGGVARAILEVARTVGEWPQLGTLETTALAAVVGVAWWARTRWVAAVAVVFVAFVAWLPQGPPAEPTVVFLDVGQGDATLLLDPSGAVVLMDGGRDPGVLRAGLRRHGVSHIDLLVASHGDADHVGGLTELMEAMPVGRLWVPEYAEAGAILDGIIAEAERDDIPVDRVRTGDGAGLGAFDVEVLGPARRYATDNDGSVVLLATAAGHTLLLPGDVQAVGQHSLVPQHPDILLVPHHGAATTDPAWLAETVGRIAVISVGPNTYGHPAPETMDVLEASSAEIRTTWEEGDIAIRMR